MTEHRLFPHAKRRVMSEYTAIIADLADMSPVARNSDGEPNCELFVRALASKFLQGVMCLGSEEERRAPVVSILFDEGDLYKASVRAKDLLHLMDEVIGPGPVESDKALSKVACDLMLVCDAATLIASPRLIQAIRS